MNKYGTDPELDKLVDSKRFRNRLQAVYKGYGLDKLVHDEDYRVRWEVARRGYGLDILVHDKHEYVRQTVAEQGYGLDKLVNDEVSRVRWEVARQGYGLAKLVNDEDYEVREMVAYQGYGLDKLINDKNTRVRAAVAYQGYGLDILIHDEDYQVRRAVAFQGYGLDILNYDEKIAVHYAAQEYLQRHNYASVFDWAKDNGVDINMDEWINSDNWRKRLEVAKLGYGLDVLVLDKNNNVHDAAQEYLKEHNYKTVFDWAKDNGVDIDIDKWIHSGKINKKLEVIKLGYGLDVLVLDKNNNVRDAAQEYLREHNYKSVFDWASDNGVDINIDEWLQSTHSLKRCEVAKAGYGLDILISDDDNSVRDTAYKYLGKYNYKTVFDWAKDNGVDINIDEWINSDDANKRYEVARAGYGLDKLVNDEYYSIRLVVAKQGYGLDKLVNDEAWNVRQIVAKQGYGLDKLVNDEAWIVRNAVTDYLKNYNYKSVFDWAKDNNVDINIEEWLNSADVYKKVQVAKARYCLDKLVHDKDKDVRKAVAQQGYGLDILNYDEDEDVRLAAYIYLRDHNYKTVFDWAKDNGVDINIDEWILSTCSLKRLEVAKQGYGLAVLVDDKDADVRNAVAKYLKNNNLTIKKWMEQNGIDTSTESKILRYLEAFIHKVEYSSKIKIETSYDSVEEFFEDTTDNSTNDKNSIAIVTVDTKIPLIKLEKTKLNNKNVFNFIVTIPTENEDFSIRSIFETKEKFTHLLQLTVNALYEHPQFSKYADELENCI